MINFGKHMAITRRIVTKRWYYRLRIRKMRKAYERANSRIMLSAPGKDNAISEELSRYAQKEYWYHKKMFYSYGKDSGEHTDR